MGAPPQSQSAQANPSPAQKPVHSDMPPASAFTPAPPHDDAPQSPSFALSASRIPPCTWVCLVLIPLLWLLATVTSPRPLFHILFTVLSVLPAVLVARFVLRNFADEAVTNSFLISQFLLGALPLSLILVVVELILVVVFTLVFFSSELVDVGQALSPQLSKSPRAVSRAAMRTVSDVFASALSSPGEPFGKTPDTDQVLQLIKEHVPLWKLILFLLLSAFVVAAATEELGKWALARRYTLVNKMPHNVDCDRRITCRGILAVACMGALGFATTENYGYAMGLTSSPFNIGLVGVLLLRALLAFPLHVGAQFYVAVAAAQAYVFNEPISVMKPLAVAVGIHGLFDAMAMLMVVLIGVEGAPWWLSLFVPVLQSCLTFLLVMLCRGRYKALLERERVVLLTADPV